MSEATQQQRRMSVPVDVGGVTVGAQAFTLSATTFSGLGAVSNGVILRVY
jgi:hypothetical protein